MISCLSFQVIAQNQSNEQDGSSNPVESCTRKGHAQCVRLTAKEVFQHGTEGKWSNHWKTMSYIGRACSSEKGDRKGRTIELLFAPPHYRAMFFVNLAGLTKYVFSKKEAGHLEESSN